jgi:hypothetical protein
MAETPDLDFNFSDLLTPKPFRWPKKGDLPFRQAKRPDAAAPLEHDHLTRAVWIVRGFMLAGTALADQTLKDQRYDLVYPMLFNYRHAIETGLKWLLTRYGPPLNVTPERLNDTHDLLKLWNDCIRLFRACGTDDDEDEGAIEAVGKTVKQFHDWDKGGIAFRYPTKKNGTVVAYQHSYIDICNLKDVMEGVANFFSGSDGWLDIASQPINVRRAWPSPTAFRRSDNDMPL